MAQFIVRQLEDDVKARLKLPKALAAHLERVSIDQGIAPSTIARKAIAEHLSYLEWKERAIALGDADLAAGRLMTTEQVFAAVAKQRAKRSRILHQRQQFP